MASSASDEPPVTFTLMASAPAAWPDGPVEVACHVDPFDPESVAAAARWLEEQARLAAASARGVREAQGRGVVGERDGSGITRTWVLPATLTW